MNRRESLKNRRWNRRRVILTVVNFVGSISLYHPVSALDSCGLLSYSSHRCNSVQPGTGLPQMENRQMIGKLVVDP
jgi:hypothetical protein